MKESAVEGMEERFIFPTYLPKIISNEKYYIKKPN